MIGHLDGLIACDQGSQSYDAAVARREAGALPYVSKQAAFGIGRQLLSDLPNILICEHRFDPFMMAASSDRTDGIAISGSNAIATERNFIRIISHGMQEARWGGRARWRPPSPSF